MAYRVNAFLASAPVVALRSSFPHLGYIAHFTLTSAISAWLFLRTLAFERDSLDAIVPTLSACRDIHFGLSGHSFSGLGNVKLARSALFRFQAPL